MTCPAMGYTFLGQGYNKQKGTQMSAFFYGPNVMIYQQFLFQALVRVWYNRTSKYPYLDQF